MQPSSTPFPAEGLHLGVSNETYHGDREAVSRSQLAKIVMGTPGDLKYAEDNPTEPTPVMVTGSLTDDLFYQGADYTSANYLVKPEGFDGRSKDGKRWTKDHQEDARPRVTWDQWVCAQGMVLALRSSLLACEYLGRDENDMVAPGALWQSSAVHRCPDTGVLRKARADTALPERRAIVDLKTKGGAVDSEAWKWHCKNYRYDLQPGLYLPVYSAAMDIDFEEWYWVVVSRDPPHRVEVHPASDAIVEAGKEDIRRATRLYAACKKSGRWPTSSGVMNEPVDYRIY
jgi:hypothetical protein